MDAQLVIPDPRVTPTISVEYTGRLLGLSRPSAYKAARSGQIPVIRIGGRMVVPTAKVLAMLGLDGGQA